MPYGKTPRGSVKRAGSVTGTSLARARASATKIQRTFRKAAQNAKRTPFVRATRTLAVKNTAALARLKQASYGPIQQHTSEFVPTWTGGKIHVTAAHPALFHINNLHNGVTGPAFFTTSSLTHLASTRPGKFVPYQGPSNKYNEAFLRDAHNIPNGPKIKILYVEYKLKISGFVDATNILVQVIRQKKIVGDRNDFWHQDPEGNDHGQHLPKYLPNCLPAFTKLAGFTANTIDRSKYSVEYEKKIYMNSKGSANPLDAVQDRNTTDATTSPIRYCTVKVPFKYPVKQLYSTQNQHTGGETPEAGGDPTQVDPMRTGSSSSIDSSWDYSNIHPFANKWLLISSDDQTDFGSIVDSDAVQIEVIRKCVWRDPQG